MDGVDLEVYHAEILGLVGGKRLWQKHYVYGCDAVAGPPGARIRGNVRYKGQDLLTLDEKCLTQMRDRDITIILSTINTLQLERR